MHPDKTADNAHYSVLVELGGLSWQNKAPIRTAVRACTEADIPAVIALFERVYPKHRWADRIECERYLHEMLFGNPWRDLELPSWLSEEHGLVTGFIGIMPRKMLLQNRPIRAAVGFLFMVDPEQRDNLIALRLVQAVLTGPQDVFIVDGANDEARRLCLAAGGCAPLLYRMHWTRPLRPARYALSLLACDKGMTHAAAALRPFGRIVDAAAARMRPNRFNFDKGNLIEEPLAAADMASHLPQFLRGSALRPDDDLHAISWLLDHAARKTRHGVLRARAVRDPKRNLLGWYLYYVRKHDVAEVLQIMARPGSFDCVLQQLLSDAWRQEATALRGRWDPRHMQSLSDRHCWCRSEGVWTLVHSRHADIVSAFERGDADFSRLDGEWWLRFLGE